MIRRPAVAGMFYPDLTEVLVEMVDDMLAAAHPEPGWHHPKAVIVPHAGYIYSGVFAALAYARVSREARRVAVFGPCHRVPVRGLAYPESDRWQTPLGETPVAALGELAELPQVVVSEEVHLQEHSLEVQLPFLQATLADFTLLPFAVGDASPEEVAEVIDALWDDPETLIVISSDLSHHHPYAEAQRLDRATLQQILDLDGPLHHRQACGATPINGLLVSARRRGLRPELLGAGNSGDTAGSPSRVVGYASLAVGEWALEERALGEQNDG